MSQNSQPQINYALPEDFLDRLYRFLWKSRCDYANFGIHPVKPNYVQVINKDAFGVVVDRLWKIRYNNDEAKKQIYKQFSEALDSMGL